MLSPALRFSSFIVFSAILGCGSPHKPTSDLKIFNGIPADLDSPVAKYTVGIVNMKDENSPICTGIIISPKHILTATHCGLEMIWYRPEIQWGVSFGAGVLPIAEFKVTKADFHFHDDTVIDNRGMWIPKVVDGFELNDIAIMTLPDGFEIPSHMSPIDIADATDFAVGSDVILAGYGLLGLKAGRPIPNKPVKLNYTTSRIFKIFPSETQELIQYQSDNGQNSACYGDSGGPMFIEDPLTHQWKLVGITKQLGDGEPCVGSGIYTNAAFFKKWVLAKIGRISGDRN